jgi:hypothetical protein
LLLKVARDRPRGLAALVNRLADMQVTSRRMHGADFACSWLANRSRHSACAWIGSLSPA